MSIVYIQCLLWKPLAAAPIRARSERSAESFCNAFVVLAANGSFPVRARSRFTLAEMVRACFFKALYLVCNCSTVRFSTYFNINNCSKNASKYTVLL